MGVTTKADELLDSARFDLELAQLLVKQAMEKIEELCDTSTWGHDEFRAEFQDEVEYGLKKLAKFKGHSKCFGRRRFFGVPRGWFLPDNWAAKLAEKD